MRGLLVRDAFAFPSWFRNRSYSHVHQQPSLYFGGRNSCISDFFTFKSTERPSRAGSMSTSLPNWKTCLPLLKTCLACQSELQNLSFASELNFSSLIFLVAGRTAFCRPFQTEISFLCWKDVIIIYIALSMDLAQCRFVFHVVYNLNVNMGNGKEK